MKKVLVIGGGAYQVVLIKRLKEKEYMVYCLDKNSEAPGFKYADGYKVIDVLDKDACLSYAKTLGISAVMTYGATLTLPTVSYIAEQLNLPALPMKTAEIARSKYEIKKCLDNYECNIMGKFFEMDSVTDARNFLFELPCVLKPSDGSGSKGVVIVQKPEELESALGYAFGFARYGKIYCESLIHGEEYSVEAFVCRHEIYIYGIVKTTFFRTDNTNEGIEYGHRTPSGLSQKRELLISEEIKKAIKALNITMGSVNFDVILSSEDGKPYIIDCGIRVGQNLLASHIIPLSRGVSVIDNNINLALNQKTDAVPRYTKNIATRLLIYNPGIINNIKDMKELKGKNGIVDIILKKKVGDKQNVYQEKSDTCGWVICEGQTPDEAEHRAMLAKNELKQYIEIY